jgi:hypothetical protein
MLFGTFLLLLVVPVLTMALLGGRTPPERRA